jgi:uncharacterized protein
VLKVFPDTKENPLIIDGPCGGLEAVLHQGAEAGMFASKNWLLLLCHPHPLHGGTMDNKVVTTLMRSYRDLGIHVLRFNFRGVGNSQGVFDQAIGEQDDLLAVAAWAQQKLPECSLLLAGFSFGSSIAAQVSYRLPAVVHLTLVAPPVERYPYDQGGRFPCGLCVVQGDLDERVIAAGVYEWQAGLQGATRLLRYPTAGHFFHGCLTQLKTDLTAALVAQLG